MKTGHQSRRGRRRGYSLIEMIVVVGAVTIVLSLCGLVLHALMRMDRSGRREFDDATTISRLARQFRDDVRSASSADSRPGKEKGPLLEIKLSDKRNLTYEVQGTRLIRTGIGADGKVENREGYRVDRLGPLTFEAKGPWVRMNLARASSNPAVIPHPPILVEARLNKDQGPGANGGDSP